MPSVLISLVGTSPIPILLAHHDLCQDAMAHHLVASHETNRYAVAVRDVTNDPRIQITNIDHEKEPHLIVEQLNDICNGYPNGTSFILNYTGGTKAMVAASLVAFSRRAPEGCWYLDESSNTWRRLNGETRQSRHSMSLNEIGRLHGFQVTASDRIISPGRAELTNYIGGWWAQGARYWSLQDRGQVWAFQVLRILNNPRERARVDDLAAMVQRLPQSAGAIFPRCDLTNLQQAVNQTIGGGALHDLDYRIQAHQRVLAAVTYLDGACLEDLVIMGFQGSGLLNHCAIHGSTVIQPLGDNNAFHQRELDVCIAKPNGLIVVSVTANTDKKVVQRKMEEALTLARDLGGYSAKAVVVSAASNRSLEALKRVNLAAAGVRPTGCQALQLLLNGQDMAFTQMVLGGMI